MRIRMLGMAVVLAAGLGCGKHEPPPAVRPPAAVTVAEVVVRDAPRYLDEIGRCIPRETVTIRPQVGGQITQIHFVDGADVKAGDLLFTIDPRPFRARLDAAEAASQQAKAALALARLDFTRAEKLLERKALSQQDFDTSRNTVEVSEARMKQAQAEVETARLNLEYCSIRSPIDGRTGHRLVDVGNIVSANGGSLLVVHRIDPIYADFTISENDLGLVQQSRKKGELRVEVRLPDQTGEPHVGDITFLDNNVQNGSGSVTLRATLANADRRLWPGQYIKVRLILETLKGALLVPAAAPQLSAKGSFVYVVKADSTAELRPVTLGQRQDALVVVEQGLQPGERVVTGGHIGVMPGGPVRIEGPKTPAPAAADETKR